MKIAEILRIHEVLNVEFSCPNCDKVHHVAVDNRNDFVVTCFGFECGEEFKVILENVT